MSSELHLSYKRKIEIFTRTNEMSPVMAWLVQTHTWTSHSILQGRKYKLVHIF